MTGPMIRWDYSQLISQVESQVRKDENGCWIWCYGSWAHGVKQNRYPRITISGLQRNVVRHVLFALTGEWGEEACHSCDVIACVNPDHVRWGTQQDNLQDMRDRARFAAPPSGDSHWTRKLSDEERKKRSEQQTEYWSNPEVRSRHRERMQEVRKMREC